MQSIARLSLAATLLATAGCSSYHKTDPIEIASHPETVTNKNVRVHFESSTIDSSVGAGRTVSARAGETRVVIPDSVVSLHVKSVNYPMLIGQTGDGGEPRLYGTSEPALPLQVSLDGSRKVEVHGFDAGRTIFLVFGVACLAAVIAGAVSDTGGGQNGDLAGWLAGIFGGIHQQSPPLHPPQN
jgi:hypothetical protein